MDLIDFVDLKPKGRYKNKRQIILTHTSRPITYYLTGLRTRHYGSYDRIPHFVISREGKIFKLLETETYSNVLDILSYNKKSIIISLENLGWLKKNPLKNNYINWIGDVTNEEVFQRKWRGHFFWQKYTDNQMDSLVKLCNHLSKKHDIPFKSVGHNVKLDRIEKYEGVTSKSNYDRICTSLSPAFDFDLFINKIESYHE